MNYIHEISWKVHEDPMNLSLDILKTWIFVHKKIFDEYTWTYFFMNNSWSVIFMKLHHWWMSDNRYNKWSSWTLNESSWTAHE